MDKEIKYLLEAQKDKENQQKEFIKYLIDEENNLKVIRLQILSLLLINFVIELLLFIIICYKF